MNRYIDADKIVITAERGICVDELIFIPMIDVHRSIDATPTADVVEVVRCKDCKYFKMMGTTPRCNFYKGLATTVSPQTDYCSYGERREE